VVLITRCELGEHSRLGEPKNYRTALYAASDQATHGQVRALISRTEQEEIEISRMVYGLGIMPGNREL
jgi:hypothetical protein